MRPKLHRLIFFAMETSLVVLTMLGAAGQFLHRQIDEEIIALGLGGLFLFSLVGLPIWCAIYSKREPRLELVGGITFIGVILWFFLGAFFPG